MRERPRLAGRFTLGAVLMTLAWGVIPCALPFSSARAAEETEPLRILAVANRHLELEPCGCTSNPMGGVEREAAFLEALSEEQRKSLVSVTAGITFVPQSASYSADRKKFFIKKAGYMIDALNRLSVSALAPALEDFVLGEEAMGTLQRAAKFPFVSANLRSRKTGRLLYPRSLKMTRGGPVPIHLIGLSGTSPHGYPGAPDVTADNPFEALQESLKEIGDEPTLVVVLSSLSTREHTEISRRFPKVNVIIGGVDVEWRDPVEQFHPALVTVQPEKQGRTVALLTFSPPRQGVSSLFNERAADNIRKARMIWLSRLMDAEKRLGKKLAAKPRRALERAASEWQALVTQTNLIPLHPYEGTTTYDFTVIALDARFARPVKELSELLAKSKKDLGQ